MSLHIIEMSNAVMNEEKWLSDWQQFMYESRQEELQLLRNREERLNKLIECVEKLTNILLETVK